MIEMWQLLTIHKKFKYHNYLVEKTFQSSASVKRFKHYAYAYDNIT